MLLANIAYAIKRATIGKKFEKATKRPMETQEELLLNLIRKNSQTAYGIKYGFKDIKTVKDYQEKVPIIKYKDIRKYTEMIKDGEEYLLSAEKTLMFTTSSGTTGKPKFIPVNDEFLKDYKKGWELWLCNAIKDHPKMLSGKIAAIVSPKTEGKTKAGINYGSISGLTYDDESKIIKRMYATIPEIFEIKDYNARYYALLRMTIPENITFLVTPNPSTILIIIKKAQEFKEDIIKDTEEGTLSDKYNIEPEIRKKIEKMIKKDKKKAEHLKKVKFIPKNYWPNLALIGCWKEGTMPVYLKQFPEYFGKTSIRDIGLLASEGRMTIPHTDRKGEGIPNIQNTFFEFIPIKGGKAATLDKLKKKEQYYIIITNSSGLYRYNINDIIKVERFHNKTPIIEFMHKGEHVTSITGEKLTEWQAVNAMRKTKEKINDFTVCIHWGKTPRYDILLEPKEKISDKKAKELIKRFDKALCDLNEEYKNKRESMRLDMPRVRIVDNGSYEKMFKEKVDNGAHIAQIKTPRLVSSLGFEKKFKVIKEVKT